MSDKRFKRLTDYVLLGYQDAMDYLRGDDSARGRSDPAPVGETHRAYQEGWIAAYMDEYEKRRKKGLTFR